MTQGININLSAETADSAARTFIEIHLGDDWVEHYNNINKEENTPAQAFMKTFIAEAYQRHILHSETSKEYLAREEGVLHSKYNALLRPGADSIYLVESIIQNPNNLNSAIAALINEEAFFEEHEVLLSSLLMTGHKLDVAGLDEILINSQIL